jgi:hypothetical protein
LLHYLKINFQLNKLLTQNSDIMKKILLSFLAIIIAVSVSAQVVKHVAHYNGATAKFIHFAKSEMPLNQTPIVKSFQKNHSAAKTNNVITDIPLGVAANAFGFYGNGRTYLWADDNIGSVTFSHRADVAPGSGFLQYDLSTDIGATFTNNVGPVYSPDGTTSFNARYPQGAIYNPFGNTDANNAYFTYMAPTLEGSNGGWGGIAYGVHKLDNTTAATQDVWADDGTYWYSVPTAFHVCQTGEAWYADWNDSLDANTYPYTNNFEFLLAKGLWNSGTSKFDYTRFTITVPMSTDPTSPLSKYCADQKIAFAPDGQTGYIAFIGHDDYTFMPDSVYYPILYKTTDGGTTWSTTPMHVDLSNIPDLQAALFPDSGWLYSSGFELDLAVDGDGNPYMAMNVGVAAGGWSIATAPGYIVTAAVYSTDGGTTWDARVLDYNETFRGTFAAGTADEIISDPRPQIATDMAGTVMFVTWLDTDTLTFGTADGNYYPDLHLRGFYVSNHIVFPDLSQSSNVTAGSAADGAAYMGSASYYVFDHGAGSFEVPMAYQQMDPTNSATAVTYHYIKGATIVNVKESETALVSVSQNYPNPVNGTSLIIVNLTKAAELSLSISNLLGQKVYETSKGNVDAGLYNFSIDGSTLNAGVYIYTVKAGDDFQVTKKMIVE